MTYSITVKCVRCENDRDMMECISIKAGLWTKYLCYECIADIAAILPLGFDRIVVNRFGPQNIWATYKEGKVITKVRPDPAQTGPLNCPNRYCPKHKTFRSIASLYNHCRQRRNSGHPACLEKFVERFQ